VSTPAAGRGPLRPRVERRSAVLLVFLSGQRRILVAAVPIVLLVAVALVRGPLAVVPGVLLLGFVGWLAYLSWPRLAPPQRVMRVAVLAGR
jgi:hypothetical protein